MMKSTTALSLAAIAAVLLSPAAAGAEGLYISGGAGVNFPRESNLDGTGFKLDADIDEGFAGVGALGYEFDRGIRLEGELGYRTGEIGSVSGTSASGDVNVWSGMGNLLYDIPTGWAVKPFIGAGIGLARVDADGVSPVSTTAIDDNDTSIAFQGIAGLGYQINEQLNLNISYRYFTAPDLGFMAANGTRVDSDYSAHTVLIGLRFSFGAPKKMMQPAAAPAPMPAPPPPPAPAPAPMVEKAPAPAPAPLPRNFLVFFDWNSAALTPQASGIVATAAESVKQGKIARIVATGHADRSGPRNYNQGLSNRRAAAVKAQLVKLGIPAASIAVIAKGETDPLVPTADGVREPQNRRVEILLQ